VRCPACGGDQLSVIDSRPVPLRNGIRRRRKCLACGHRLSTDECIVPFGHRTTAPETLQLAHDALAAVSSLSAFLEREAEREREAGG
jgi:transcriptional regulator NrdR family protein